jgi:two-component system, chemotaxis family, sensor kinase CheA
MDIDNALPTFFAEAEEILLLMEDTLLRMDDGDRSPETINELFRAAHTIKGSSGMFGFCEIVDFTHLVENVLDMAREGKIIIDGDLVSILLACRDQLTVLVDNAKQKQNGDAACSTRSATLSNDLNHWLDEKLGTNEAEKYRSTSTPQNTQQKDDENKHDLWYISTRLDKNVLQGGMDPIAIIRFLGSLGEIKQVTTITDYFPPINEFDPEQLYLGFEIILRSSASLAEIKKAFMFVWDDSIITIIPPRSNTQAYIDLIHSLPKSMDKLGQILVRTNVITKEDLELALDTQKQQAKERKPVALIGTILVETQDISPHLISAALSKQGGTEESVTKLPETRFIRIEADRLDKLINLIGELVVSRQRVDLLASNLGAPQLIEAVTAMRSFTEQIRDAALTLRMVAIGDTFLRFKRVVRDTAKELNKEIELEIEGADTELDRSMVEKLNDPLMHIVRNAIDHGIETLDVRKIRNKPKAGTISLRARHDAGNIVIDITDDGGGLDLERIRRKAIDNGLIAENAQLSAQEISMLIFHPGLSTADTISNLSGRGVGMDVVKRNIEALRGIIEIETELGVGTCISIRLPLTLAIIDGFHVSAGNIDFIIPQNSILECLDLQSVCNTKEQHYVNLREEQVPFIRLQELYDLKPLADVREKLVVVQFGEKRAGIAVDSLFGEIQTVVKPMGPIFQTLKGIGGSSVLGTGSVALIVDVQQLISFAMSREATRNNKLIEALQE